jgi:hypothetical protein
VTSMASAAAFALTFAMTASASAAFALTFAMTASASAAFASTSNDGG